CAHTASVLPGPAGHIRTPGDPRRVRAWVALRAGLGRAAEGCVWACRVWRCWVDLATARGAVHTRAPCGRARAVHIDATKVAVGVVFSAERPGSPAAHRNEGRVRIAATGRSASRPCRPGVPA